MKLNIRPIILSIIFTCEIFIQGLLFLSLIVLLRLKLIIIAVHNVLNIYIMKHIIYKNLIPPGIYSHLITAKSIILIIIPRISMINRKY